MILCDAVLHLPSMEDSEGKDWHYVTGKKLTAKKTTVRGEPSPQHTSRCERIPNLCLEVACSRELPHYNLRCDSVHK